MRFKNLFSVLLSMVTALSGIIPVAAAETSSALKGIAAVRGGTPFYLKDGRKINYSGESGYYPQVIDGEVMIPLDMLKNVLGFSGSYDKKQETAVMTKNGKTVTIRAGEDGIYTNGKAKYIENKAINTDRTLLVPFKEVANAFGMKITEIGATGIIAASDASQLSDSARDALIRSMASDKNAILKDDFENGEWTYAAWSGAAAEHGIKDGGNGGSAAWLGVTQKGFSGMLSKSVKYDESRQYRLTVDLKKSADFANQSISISMWPYDSGGTFLGGINFAKQIGDLSTGIADDITTDWQTFSFVLPKYYMRWETYADLANFQLNIMSTKVGSGAAAGGFFFDNAVLEEYVPASEYVACDFVADKYAAWYYPGETVTFKTDNPDALKPFSSITAEVYNGDGELVFENTSKTADIIENGWSYLPENLGYYEVKFTAASNDGTQRPIAKSYVRRNGDNAGTITLVDQFDDTYSFAVVKGEAKPMAERNNTLMASVNPTRQNSPEYRLLDMLGISGLRLHAIKWGDSYGDSYGVEKKRGEYTWAGADMWIEPAEKYGFKNIVANVFSTPEWAVEEQWRGTETVGSFGYIYQKMGPEKMEDLENFIKEFYNHYKGRVDTLEFWNEPHYGNTAFWADTPEKLSQMTKAAYKALREVDPEGNMKMAAHAWNQGYQLYRELIADKAYYDSFDQFSFHSRYGEDYGKYTSSDKEFGYESKPAFASEEYLYGEYTKGVKKDHNLNSMSFMAKMMNHVKHNYLYTAMFEVTDNIPDEVRVWCGNNNTGTSHVIGMFSPFPYIEPHKGAVVAYNLYENMGLDFTYQGEYDLGGGQRAVYFLSDGEPLVIVWNSDGKACYLSEKLKNTLGENAQMTTFEGKSTDINSELKAMTMYYLKGFDKDKLDSIEKQPDTALNDDYIKPYYTCEQPEFMPVDEGYAALDESKVSVITQNPPEPPFDKTTFKLADNVEWVTDNWNWVTQESEKPAGYDAKFSAYVNEEGFWLAVNVNDSVIYQPTDADIPWDTNMYQCDSMQFAIDCLGTGDATKRCEFQVGNRGGKDVLFKHSAPEVGFNMLEGWHDSNTVLDEKYVRIEKTGTGLMYKVFLPMSELYPFQYSSTVDHMRISVLVNNNDGNGRSYMEWSSGIGGNKDPKQFGALKIK